MIKFEKNIIDFLKQSNYIESEYSKKALNDAISAWGYLIKKDNITFNRIIEAHRLLIINISPNIAGKLRDYDVRVGYRICPKWYNINELLINWVKLHAKANTEEKIKQAHIAFEKIHPFGDGNGRIGRIIMNWQRIKNKLPILIIHEGSQQREYYKWFMD